MKFFFSTFIESPSERSIFQALATEAGGKAKFIGREVLTEYDGDIKDEAFDKLMKLYESKPNHCLTLSTQ